MSAPAQPQNVSVKVNSNGIAFYLSVLATITLAIMHAAAPHLGITLLVALAPVLAWFGIMLTILVAMVTVAIIATILESLAGKSDA